MIVGDGDRQPQAVRLADAGIALAGTDGLGAVTYRSVEDAAGLPRGSTSNHYATRTALIEAMIRRQLHIERERSHALAHELLEALASPDRDARLGDATARIVAWVDDAPAFSLAHYELMLAAARIPDLHRAIANAAQELWRLLAPVATAAGSSDPARDARKLLAVIDGILLDRLTHPDQDPHLLSDALRDEIDRMGAQ